MWQTCVYFTKQSVHAGDVLAARAVPLPSDRNPMAISSEIDIIVIFRKYGNCRVVTIAVRRDAVRPFSSALFTINRVLTERNERLSLFLYT